MTALRLFASTLKYLCLLLAVACAVILTMLLGGD